MSEKTIEKLSWLVCCHYNVFHADLITRAMTDDNISMKDFIIGCVQIHQSEKDNEYDEFVPKEFENV